MIKGDSEKVKALYRRFKWAMDTRDSYVRPEWQNLSKYLSPAHGRFLDARDNIPGKVKVDRNSIINGTATRAMSIAVAGIKGGLVPHSLKWFKLGLYDAELEKSEKAKEWLFAAEKVMYSVFNRSNFYEAIYMPFLEQLCFGTGPLQVNEHPTRVVNFDPWTIGEYALMTGEDKMVDTGFREYWMTIRNIAQKFGRDEMSLRLRNMLQNNPDQYAKIIHCIKPRDDYDSGKRDNLNMPFASVWIEATGDQNVLGESGYRTKPVMYPRWLVVGEDAYGSDCPGMQSLGDVKQLQKMETDKLAALALMVRPPMNVPSKLWGRLKLFPNAQNPVSQTEGETVKRTLEINYDIERARQEIRDVEDRIKEGFYNDLFLMLLNAEKSGTTAYEIAKRNEEKLVLLGPVVERQNSELLTPTIDRVFDICMERGMFPVPPPELQGQDIRVEYVSLLAQAQKAVGVSGIEKTMGFMSNVLQVFPETRHKIKQFEMVDEFADMSGMNPNLIRSNEDAQKLHEADLAGQQQAAQQEQLAAGASTAKELSETELGDGESALNRVMEQLPAP